MVSWSTVVSTVAIHVNTAHGLQAKYLDMMERWNSNLVYMNLGCSTLIESMNDYSYCWYACLNNTCTCLVKETAFPSVMLNAFFWMPKYQYNVTSNGNSHKRQVMFCSIVSVHMDLMTVPLKVKWLCVPHKKYITVYNIYASIIAVSCHHLQQTHTIKLVNNLKTNFAIKLTWNN